ncbi:MAG TPA: LamG-like jellyroll fold domain-containing protein [Devosia sp.]|nr:LamG-like jellyroll fold domain-containing protein [Devosia sp.]
MARRDWSTSNFLRYGGAVIAAAPLTIAYWAKTSITGTPQVGCGIFNSGAGVNNNNFRVGVSSSDVVEAITCDGAGTAIATSSTTFTADTWFHLCGVFASASDRRAFLDGAGKGTNSTNKTPSGLNRTSVGKIDNTANSRPWASGGTGDIAEVAIWNAALDDAQVAMLATGLIPTKVRPDALVAYWPLVHGYSPEINLLSNTSVLTMQGTLSMAPHCRVFMPRHRQAI